MSPLEGRRIALTGAAGGMGGLLARQLAAEGASVVGIDRVKSEGCADALIADLSSREELERLAQMLAAEPVDILINLAGIQYFGPLADQPAASLWNGYAVNLIAPAFLAQAVIPGMRARGRGQIVNIGSVFGAIPFAHFATYSSAKAGLRGLSESLRRELAGSGIAVTHVAPRAVRTPLNSDKVLRFAELTRMNMDEPEHVVTQILSAIRRRVASLVIGFPESLFVRVNAVAPGLVDRALAANDRKAAALFS